MLNPTHVEITILEAKHLVSRGKYGTNDAYTVLSMGREKFQTSIIERGKDPFVWNNETFLLEIPFQGNSAVIEVSIYHRRLLGDECLGVTSIFLKDFQPTVNPKLMTYSLQGKSEKYPSQGQLKINLAFKEIKLSVLGRGGPRRSMKEVAQEVIKAQAFAKSKTTSLRSITNLLLSERKGPYATPVKELSVDANENEIKSDVLQHGGEQNSFGSPRLVRVQSARGKINARREIQNFLGEQRTYITQKVIPRPRSLDSTEESDFEYDQGQDEKIESRESLPQANAPSPGVKFIDDNDDDVPLEFRAETKKSVVETVFKLRRVIKSQERKIAELEDYIDSRLALVMAKNPGSLEIE